MRSIGQLAAALALALAIPAGATSSFAQTWPQRTVRLIVPLPPGNGMDISARLFAERLSGKWRQSVVVENLPGSDGIIAAREFVNRRDNHTLLYSFAGLITINPLLRGKLPYDPAHDLVPIAMTSDNVLAIAASASLNIASLADLEKLARTRVGKLNWASSPGIPYFAFAGFLKYAGLDMVYVSYRDFNPAFVDVGEGRIDIIVAGIGPMVPHSHSGKIRLLAVLNRERTPVAPDVPTVIEIGYPSLAFDGVTGFYGWRDIPDELKERIAADVRAVVADPTIAERLKPTGTVVRAGTAADFAAAIEEQRAKTAAIAEALGVKPEQ
jgi:tripartite-type tricarboxylate transporter receptor subunit TctC